MPNSENLKDMKCPKCNSTGPSFNIVGKAWFQVYDDGASDFWEIQWTDNSPCACACGFIAKVRDFKKKSKS